ncbi:hypothetical protein KKH03_04210 [Patescibacteria group bacterium]|nr:hypothetical protein [Patescibacteria group bacterium]
MDRRIGSIVSLGTVTSSSRGTHLLKLDDGDTILLKSTSIDLDDEKFKDKVVEVKGVLTYNTGDKPVMEVMNIDIVDNQVAETSSAPVWKTWSGELFHINYRDDFTLEQSGSSVIFSRPVVNETNVESTDDGAKMNEEKDIVSIAVEKKSDGESLADKLGVNTDESSPGLSLGLVKSKIGIQNLDAYKKGEQGDSTLVYYTEDDSYIYTISFEAGDKDNQLVSENIFYEMLASFELGQGLNNALGEDSTEAISSRTLDVQTYSESDSQLNDENSTDSAIEIIDTQESGDLMQYESDTFGFVVSYPKNWYFEGSAGNETGIQRHYEFGKDPLDESPAVVGLDLLSSVPVSGTKVSYGGREFTKVVTGSVEEIYFKGENRAYRFSGNLGNESLLMQMASTLTEK